MNFLFCSLAIFIKQHNTSSCLNKKYNFALYLSSIFLFHCACMECIQRWVKDHVCLLKSFFFQDCPANSLWGRKAYVPRVHRKRGLRIRWGNHTKKGLLILRFNNSFYWFLLIHYHNITSWSNIYFSYPSKL